MKGEQPAFSCCQILKDCGFDDVSETSTVDDLQEPLMKLRRTAAKLESLQVALLREAAVERLVEKHKSLSAPARLVNEALHPKPPSSNKQTKRTQQELSGSGISPEKPKPWPKTVDGADLLDELSETIRRFVVLPLHAAHAIALWCLWTYCYERMFYAPLLEVASPTKRCGKTTLLSVIGDLVCLPLKTSSIRPAGMFRLIEKCRPCLLVDEFDSFVRLDSDLRNVLNSGHTKSQAKVVRCAGDDHEPRLFNTFCPKAVALTGALPSTLRDRSITIPVRRKTADDQVKGFRAHLFQRPAKALREKCMRWGDDHRRELGDAEPQTPDKLNDRQKDNWFPLLAIADRAGGHWPELARKSALLLSDSLDEGDTEDSVKLLGDLRRIFAESGRDGRISTS